MGSRFVARAPARVRKKEKTRGQRGHDDERAESGCPTVAAQGPTTSSSRNLPPNKLCAGSYI